MGIFDTFWQRQKKLKGDVPDVYTYVDLPETLRVQIVTIAIEVLGSRDEFQSRYASGHENVKQAYELIVSILRKEFGVFALPPSKRGGHHYQQQELFNFILNEEDVDMVLSAVELICRLLENMVSQHSYRYDDNSKAAAAGAVEEINARMKAAGVGYEYDGEIIRIDTELVHAEAVKPALELLRDKRYAGAEQEFRSAFEHYRKGKTKEALTDALKSIESTMKVICDKRGWTVAPTDTAKKLIEVCLANGLIPTYWQNHFTTLRSMLESSVPTARNKTSGHGQGVTIQQVPDYLASYVLHMTASTIVFLVKAEQALP
jgi:hypothetical protein